MKINNNREGKKIMENLENKNNELMVTEENVQIAQKKQSAGYCSIDLENADMKTKKKLFNALNKCDILINDIVGKTIKIKDFIVQPYNEINDETGEYKEKFRTIIFDDKGTSYVSTAYGIRNILDKILQVFGEPATWGDELLEVKIVKKKTKDNKDSLSLEIVE